MYDEREDELQWKWCKRWKSDHEWNKIIRYMLWQKCKIYLRLAWREFLRMFKYLK